MIEFRDRYTQEIGARLIVHTNTEAIAEGTTAVSGRDATLLRSAEDEVAARCPAGGRLRCRLRRRATRRGALASQGTHLLAARRQRAVGSEEPAAGVVESAEQPHSTRARASACSRCRTGPRSTSGATSTSRTFPSCRCTSPRSARSSCAASRSSRSNSRSSR